MAKASASTRFRKVDVDQFNEDNYQDELMDGAEEQGPNESEVQRFLNQYPFSTLAQLSEYFGYDHELSDPL